MTKLHNTFSVILASAVPGLGGAVIGFFVFDDVIAIAILASIGIVAGYYAHKRRSDHEEKLNDMRSEERLSIQMFKSGSFSERKMREMKERWSKIMEEEKKYKTEETATK